MSNIVLQYTPSRGMVIFLPSNYCEPGRFLPMGRAFSASEIETVIRIANLNPETTNRLKQRILELRLSGDTRPDLFPIDSDQT